MKYVEGSTCDVAVIGLGYVGLPAALMFAKSGLKTVGVDINADLLFQLSSGVCPIKEEGLVQIFGDTETRAHFSVQDSPPIAETYIIAVPTPLDVLRKIADLKAVASACVSIVPFLRSEALVIVESTIPPLTCRNVVAPILEQSGLKVGADILLAHCPERLFPGNAVAEIISNSRIIGGVNDVATDRAAALYGRFVKGELMRTDDVTAEFCKLIENAYRDVNIAFANELAGIAARLNIGIDDAIAMANKHPRVNILKPGVGVGGHCIPIDPWFIAEVAPDDAALIQTARRINDRRPEHVAARIRRAVAHLENPRVGIYGITYKPDVNDQRESPALHVVEILQRDGYCVDVYDPVAGMTPAKDVISFAKSHDVLAILVEHQEIVELLNVDPASLNVALAHPIILRF